VDLDALDDAVSARVPAWRAAGAWWEVTRGPLTEKPAAYLRVVRGDAEAELLLWVSGEAELSYARKLETAPVSEHYEVTTELGLNGCLDDLEKSIGI
jgi:hypothetical protein